MPKGLTEDEEASWCKQKSQYKPLLKKKNRTAAETTTLKKQAEEYRDWHRYHDIKRGHLKYSSKVHTSKIFSEFKEGY